MTPSENSKINNFKQFTYYGLDYLKQGRYEDCCQNFRKAAEAFCKYLIYKHWGEIVGQSYLEGATDIKGVPFLGIQDEPTLLDMELLLRNNRRMITPAEYTRLEDIRNAGNSSSHDPNIPLSTQQLYSEAEKSKVALRELTNDLFSDIHQPVPSDLVAAFNGDVNKNVVSSYKSEDMERLIDSTDFFSRQNRYILFAPKSFEGAKTMQGSLSNIPWSMIFDFNSNSKEDGLYYSFLPEIESHCTPITANNDKYAELISNTAGARNVNWVYANGISSMPATIARNITAWYSMQNDSFIKNCLKTFTDQALSRLCIISLLNNDDEKEIFDDLLVELKGFDELSRELVTIIVISTDANYRTRVEQRCQRYGFNVMALNISLSSFLNRIADLTHESRCPITSILVPARQNDNICSTADVSSIYSKLEADNIQIVHQNIAEESPISVGSNGTPPFFLGNTITWHELAEELDARRSVYYNLNESVRSAVQGSKKSMKFAISHKPGAGGTTLARRLAYDLRKEFPTVIIRKYDFRNTIADIDLLYKNVKRSILAIVENSDVSGNEIDDLIKELNGRKRVVVFVVIERRRSRGSSDYPMQRLEDKMSDTDEKIRFMRNVGTYSTNERLKSDIESRPTKDCEVIDFAFAISEKDYNFVRISEYLKFYRNQLSSNLAKFVTYVCLTYYFAQKPFSDLLVRSLFPVKKGNPSLQTYLRMHPVEAQCLGKILTQEYIDDCPTGNWRPRYARFGEVWLDLVLRKGKNQGPKEDLLLYAKQYITDIKTNNKYLTDDARQLLVNVFLQRGQDDLLSITDDWRDRADNEKFSLLLQELGFLPSEQKNVLKLLADSFPSVAHFWAHLGRYCYEKAASMPEFEEAEKYVKIALSTSNSAGDYNLQHIAGMCIRREIEYYNRNGLKISFSQLKDLTNRSRNYFAMSREINSKNIYAYIAEIQLISIVIDLGKKQSKYITYREFLFDEHNRWFLELCDQANELIQDANTLLMQLKPLVTSEKMRKSQSYLTDSETKASSLWEGDYQAALIRVSNGLKAAELSDRSRLRRLYVHILLLSKVRGDTDRIRDAFAKLNSSEAKTVNDYLTQNFLEDPGDAFSLWQWFLFVRHQDEDIDIDSVKSILERAYNKSDGHPMMQLNASYYLYILNAFEVLQNDNPLSTTKIDSTRRWIANTVSLSSNTKYAFEWLANLDGLDGIVNHKDKPEDSKLVRLHGVIKEIKSEAQGEIELSCGLKAFFTPSLNNFIRGKDETKEVTCIIGFRHEGLFAVNVRRIGENDSDDDVRKEIAEENETTVIVPSPKLEEGQKSMTSSQAFSETVAEHNNDANVNPTKNLSGHFSNSEPGPNSTKDNKPKKQEIYKFPSEQGPKILGRIDLSKFEDRKKKRKQ